MSRFDYTKNPVRSSAILTTSYVAGTILGDGNLNAEIMNQLTVETFFTKGSLTSAEIKIEFADTRKWDLSYDGQTANFTVGSIIEGQTTKARARIIADSDGGATGTLTLVDFKGTFLDDETIVEIGVTSPGTAIVNGTRSEATDWLQETSSSVSGGTSTLSLLEHTITASGKYRIPVPVLDRYVRISVKGTGTTTNSLMAITAIIGRA